MSIIVKKKLNRRRFLLLAAGAAVGAPIFVRANFIEPKDVVIRHVRITSGTPTRRVVQITDVHHKGDRAYLQSVVQKINVLSPDVVCFTGDLIERARHLPEALEILEKIKSPLYGIPGNHDYASRADFNVIAQSFARSGGQWLMDAQTPVANGEIFLTGLACRNHQVTPLPPKPGRVNILLLHYPLLAEKVQGKFDLLLAGHSHGGQVRIPGIGALVMTSWVGKYDLGLFRVPAGPLYVNPGIGWIGLPTRIHCHPEITVFDV
jgi:uncharacterized protein